VLSSQTFARSTQLRRFLESTVGRALEGRAEDLKEFTIAVEAYRRPASFDFHWSEIFKIQDAIARSLALQLAEAENVWRGRCVMVTDSAETSFCEIALALPATKRGELDKGRSVLNKYRGGPLRDFAHVTEVAALLHETEIVVHRVEDHPRRNYRWLINNPALARLTGEPAFGDLTRSLYARWLSDLESLGNTLPVPPPPLPDPDTWLRQAVESSHPTAVTEDK
jgi:hypothetical protein